MHLTLPLRSLALLAAALLLAASLVACGGSDGEDDGSNRTPAATRTAAGPEPRGSGAPVDENDDDADNDAGTHAGGVGVDSDTPEAGDVTDGSGDDAGEQAPNGDGDAGDEAPPTLAPRPDVPFSDATFQLSVEAPSSANIGQPFDVRLVVAVPDGTAYSAIQWRVGWDDNLALAADGKETAEADAAFPVGCLPQTANRESPKSYGCLSDIQPPLENVMFEGAAFVLSFECTGAGPAKIELLGPATDTFVSVDITKQDDIAVRGATVTCA